jgi:hypothetical protein
MNLGAAQALPHQRVHTLASPDSVRDAASSKR